MVHKLKEIFKKVKCKSCSAKLQRGNFVDHLKNCQSKNLKKEEKKNSQFPKAVIVLDDNITLLLFQKILEFIYCGNPTIEDKTMAMSVKKIASLFELDKLEEICDNVVNDLTELNPSIGTWLNDINGQICKDLFLNKPTFSDIKFEVEGKEILAHRIVLAARCDILAGMLSSFDYEVNQSAVPIPDCDYNTFLAFLEYLYTDHAPITDPSQVSTHILMIANRFGISRLISLCELYVKIFVLSFQNIYTFFFIIRLQKKLKLQQKMILQMLK